MATTTRRRTRWGVGQTNSQWGFNPYAPPPIPAGSYDPALDAQREAASRGLGDLQQDVTTGNTRDTVDYGLGVDNLNRQANWSLEDVARGGGRTAQDAQTAGQRLDQDYQQNVAMLQRQYQLLGGRQQQQANAAGVLKGGALLQAAAKRSANQAIDRAQLDESYNRAKSDNQTQLSRSTEDQGIQTTRLGENRDLALGQLALQAAPPDANNPLGGRSFQDRTTQLTRAERENQMFGLDVDASKAYQAAGAGYVPPQPGQPGGMPRSEQVLGTGQHVRTQVIGPWSYQVDQTGKIISRRRVG